MNNLRIEGISKRFKLSKKAKKERKIDQEYLQAVDNLSINVFPGEIYGLLGPNGAGKTTSLRMISSLIKPDSGKIYYQDKDIDENLEWYRKRVGFLTSELKLDDFFTPSYTFAYMSKLYEMDENKIEERKSLLFDRFGISKFSETKIGNLSTGMKQKTSLAICLAHDPKIIIFDEPTNGLDIVAAKVVEDFLLDLKKEGKTILLSTHIFSLSEKLCDRVGIIIDGRLSIEGKKDDLIKENGSLESLFFSLYQKEEK